MNFFGIGGWEWVIIAVAALVIFGPGKLPEVAGQAGRAVRDFRRMTSDLTGEFEKSLNESGAGELRKSFDKELRGMRGQVESVGKSVERDLKKGTTTTTAAKKAGTGTKAGTAVKKASGKSGSSSKPPSRTASSGKAAATSSKTAKAPAVVERKATKADPLADVSFMEEPAPAAPSSARRPAAAARPATSASASAQSAGLDASAMARVRERRNNAGYSRARVS